MTKEREPASFDALNKVMAEFYRPLLELQWGQMMRVPPFLNASTKVQYEPPKPLTVGKLIEFFKDYDPATVVGYNDYGAGPVEAYGVEYNEDHKMIVIE